MSTPRARDRGPTITPDEFLALRELINRHCGLSFGDDVDYLFQARLAPRVRHHGLGGFAAYRRLLLEDPRRTEELEAAVAALTTHETYLHRQPGQLRAFAERLLPALAERNRRQRRLRVWSAGCATGEEAYTVAILVARSGLFEGWDVQVLGTDLVRGVLEVARAGAYGEQAFRTPEAQSLRPWFRRDGARWLVRDEVRRMVRFARLNLLDRRGAAVLGVVDVIF